MTPSHSRPEGIHLLVCASLIGLGFVPVAGELA